MREFLDAFSDAFRLAFRRWGRLAQAKIDLYRRLEREGSIDVKATPIEDDSPD